MEITIAPAAEKFMRRMVRFGGASGGGFRLSVSLGGCAGLASEFSIEPGPRAGDSVLDHNGLKVFLPAESRLLLDGVTIDFADTPIESGLVFRNWKGGSACSTGSASAKDVVPLLPGVQRS